ncbi:hypothetical protein [Sphingobium yanoikuyae]|uniref:Uncharacterized protein n=1 Tax=Sphingobium yanoikuyae TaxID=13690 RepID=A0A291N0I2_SPHYA|nr:hypothetical protein [Sphingobium yanoikuyae]ATI80849.1 hypothetical protein A6768_13240 [Sphingobium yanoikuyae]
MAGTRPIFRVPSDADLPSLGGTAAHNAPPVLERLLEELLDAAQANCIPAPAAAPDGSTIIDAFTALRVASAGFNVAPGVALTDHFWTNAAPFRSGAVGKQLAQTARHGRAVQGFLALYGTEIRPPLLYSPNMPPFRVSGAIGTIPDIGGPYLILVACEGQPDGSAEAISAFAVPVFHAQRFVPVRSELDRDVLRALAHLQVSLDAHGVDCSVQRIRPRTNMPSTRLMASVTPAGGLARHYRLVIDPTGEAPSGRETDLEVDFTITPRNWGDGGFVAWLEAAIGSLA